MSLEHLRAMGVLRDERHWDGRYPPTGVTVWALVASAAVGAAGCIAMVIGDGGGMTWLGVSAFFAGLFCFLGVNLRGVGRRRRRLARGRAGAGTRDEPVPPESA